MNCDCDHCTRPQRGLLAWLSAEPGPWATAFMAVFILILTAVYFW